MDNDFEPKYQVLPQSKKFLNEMKSALKECEELYLATDLDREGEAIAWHLVNAFHPSSGFTRRADP